jgi:flagellar hook-length control protein FliK
MSASAPQPILTAPGGREPVPSGAPPGAPPEGPPFHSALATEWARTAIAEGQQQSHSQNPAPTGGEAASAAEASDRVPRGSTQPAHPRPGPHAAATPSGTKATAGSAPSAPTPAGCTLTLAAAPAGGTPTDEPAPSATAGRDVAQGPAARSDSSQPDPATARGSSSPAGALTIAARTHDDALPSSPTSATDDVSAIPRDSAPTAGAPAAPQDGTATASGIAGVLVATPQDVPTVGAGAQAHSTPKRPSTGDPTIPHGSPAPSANWNANDLAKPTGTSTPPAGTNADGMSGGVGGGMGGLESTASPLTAAALDGSPAAPSAELGSGAYGVGLQEAIESLHGTIQLAARQGLTQARISLQPEELGEIRINLTQTAQGLLARVTAESPAAAQALAAAHAQLRQSLSSLGLELTRLDIGHHDSAQSGGADAKGNGQGSAARGEGFAGDRPSRSTTIAAPAADPETATDSPVAEEPAPSTTAPSHGTLIDVLA